MTERERAPEESKAKFLIETAPFSFNPDNGFFILGNASRFVSLHQSELKDGGIIFRVAAAMEKKMKPEAREGLVVTSLYEGIVIELPFLRKKLAKLPQEKKAAFELKTAEVMKGVYQVVNPTSKAPKVSSKLNPMTFSALIENDGSFTLNTFGNCACLAKYPGFTYVVEYESEYPDLDDPALPLELSTHNADTPAQRLSLLAGAGTLAWLAKNPDYL